MSQPQNRYKADLREIQFRLFEQFKFEEILGQAPFEEWGTDETKMVIDECYRFVTEVVGPTNAVGDQEGCKLVDGNVIVPEVFEKAWKGVYEAGWRSLSVDPELGGQGAPFTLSVIAEELFSGANVAFTMYPGLTNGAAEVIGHFGTEEQKKKFAIPMIAGKMGGTMCLTEPNAGSDVGSATSIASPNEDGSYNIKGSKIFISAGDHQLAPNIVHLVLARIEGAEAGTKGLSLFIVPKFRVNDDGSAGEPNDVKVAGIEHKMGLNGNATCQLSFGDDEGCEGFLVGGVAHQGMKQMFMMMNYARIGVGVQGLSLAAASYITALEYAMERKQGASMKDFKDPSAPRVAIIEHADVRRMLLDMKAKTEGIRALLIKLTTHADRATMLKGKNDELAAYHSGQVELLTPLVKAYSSEQAFLITSQAIQVLGGSGYVSDHPVEQACRDSKVFSIYEGTTHIQALDLVGRKLGQAGGKYAQEFFADVGKFVAAYSEHEVLGDATKLLGKAQAAVGASAFKLLGWFKGGQPGQVPLFANLFLEMMSEATIAWLLLDGAAIALEKQKDVAESHPDHAFYEGKKAAALFYAQNILPTIIGKAKILQNGDDSALTIPDAGFATL